MAATNFFGVDPANGNKTVTEKPLLEFLVQGGNLSNLDAKKLPKELQGSAFASALDQLGVGAAHMGGDNPSMEDPKSIATKLAALPEYSKYKDFRVKETGQDSNQHYFSLMRPDGKTQQLTIKKDKDSLFDSFMYSGGPIAMMAAPVLGPALGGALGLSGTAATAVGSGLVNAGVGMAAGVDPKQALKGAALGAIPGAVLPSIPGFNNMSPIVKSAISGGVGGLLSSKGDPKAALLSALIGGATGGANQGLAAAGVSNNMLRSFMTSMLRQRLQQAVVGKKTAPKGP